jgi:DNA-binding winged helix-turn-helix (wHTH) protein/TolB-like protein/Flp pilus assembly protein TadD
MENGSPKRIMRFAEFEIDAERRRLARAGEPVALNARAFDLLAFLAENAGRVVSKDEILETVWEGQFVEEANLSVQISALRKALGEKKDAPRFLLTIPGRGYKFIAGVSHESDDEIIIERHKIERLAVAEEIDEPHVSEPGKRAAGRLGNGKLIFAGAALAVLMLLGFGGYRYFYEPPKTRIGSLAVMPFVNQNNDAGLEYLSDGLADSVAYTLSGFPELRITSRNSAFRYKGRETDAQTVGRELNVQAVLTGRVAQLGDNLSVSAELVSTADNSMIWGAHFTRKMSDIEKLQADIAGSISQKLRLKLSGADEKQRAMRASENPEAYQLYLLGRYHLNKFTDDGFRKGRDYFAQAIEKDPGYALGYAGLADAYNRLCGYNALAPNEGFPKARMAAEKALELDDQLAEAHATLGAVKHFYDWDFAGAEKEFKRALEINPNNADAHQFYSYYLTGMGRFDESMAEMRRAQELDPFSLEKVNGIGEIFHLQRQSDRALEQYRKALEMDPNAGFTHWAIGNVYVQKKMYAEAVAEYQKAIPLSGDSPDEPASLGYVYALSGKRQEALRIIEDLKERSTRQHVSPTVIAVIYGGLGEKDAAFEWLEKAYNTRDFILTLLKIEPMFDPLRDDARFAELMRRVGFPP